MLIDKYRPRRLAQVVGQAKVVGALQRIVSGEDFSGCAIWLEGSTGIGKTSIAQAIAVELGAPVNSWQYTELDGSACTVDSVRDLDGHAQRAGSGLFVDSWRVWVVNEAHAMTDRAVQAWLTLLERLPRRWIVIFTTTETKTDLFGGFSQPFADRCLCFRLTNQGLCEVFARLAHRIASREGFNGQDYPAYVTLVKKNHNSMRAVLQAIQKGEMLAD